MLSDVEKRLVPCLEPYDNCYCYLNRVNGDYTASTTNQRIANFKHPLDRFHDRPDVLRHKWREVDRFSVELAQHAMSVYGEAARVLDIALVPVNTSRPPSDPYHDPRLVMLCEKAAAMTGGLIRAVDVMHSREQVLGSHAGGPRAVGFLRSNLLFDGFGEHVPTVVVLVDDVLTTGAHYAACRDAIIESYGFEREVYVEGAFLCIHRSRTIDYEANGIEVTW